MTHLLEIVENGNVVIEMDIQSLVNYCTYIKRFHTFMTQIRCKDTPFPPSLFSKSTNFYPVFRKKETQLEK